MIPKNMQLSVSCPIGAGGSRFHSLRPGVHLRRQRGGQVLAAGCHHLGALRPGADNDAIINSKAKPAEVVFDFATRDLTASSASSARGKTGQLEFFIQAEDGWLAGSDRSHHPRDPERIESTLRMDYDTFINASFFLQGKADQFAQQEPAIARRIWAPSLVWKTGNSYRETAAPAANRWRGTPRSQQDRLNEIDAELSQEPERRRRLGLLQDQLTQISATRQAQEKTLEAVRKLAAALEEQRRTVALFKKQAEEAPTRTDQPRRPNQPALQGTGGHASLLADEAGIRAAHAAWQVARQELEGWNLLAGQFHQVTGQRTIHQMAVETARTKLEAEHTNLPRQQQATRARGHPNGGASEEATVLEAREQQLTASLENKPKIQPKSINSSRNSVN